MLPSGTVWPWISTSWATYLAAWGAGVSKRRSSSMALGMSDRSSTSSCRWSGWSARTLPVHPMSRPVVSLPAPVMTLM